MIKYIAIKQIQFSRKLLSSIIILFITFPLHSFSNECGCNSDSLEIQFSSCEPRRFENGAKVYTQYNCDSSWIVFESPNGIKHSIFSLVGEEREFTDRIGPVEFVEYNNKILIGSKTASGCCYPLEYSLIDKIDGKLLEKIGTIIFYSSEDKNKPFLVYLNNKSKNYITFTIYNINTGIEKELKFLSNQLVKIKINKDFNSNIIYQENIILDVTLTNNILAIQYFPDYKSYRDTRLFKTISVDITKYLD